MSVALFESDAVTHIESTSLSGRGNAWFSSGVYFLDVKMHTTGLSYLKSIYTLPYGRPSEIVCKTFSLGDLYGRVEMAVSRGENDEGRYRDDRILVE